VASAAVLSACATPQPGGGNTLVATTDRDGSVYGLFLAGQAAIDAGDSAAAADFFGRAQRADPGSSEIRDRAFTSALLAGDYDRAASLAATVDKSNAQLQALVALNRGVNLMAEGRYADAYAAFTATPPQAPNAGAAALLAPWAAGGAGKWDAALARPDSKDRMFRLIAALDQALLFEHSKRYEEAETAFKAAQTDKAGRSMVGPAFAAFLERRRRGQEAVAVYDDLLNAYPSDEGLLASRQRAATGGKAPPMPTFREGAAQALMAPAGALVAERQAQAALVYLRLALRLDPDREEALLVVADLLNQAGDKAGARAAYAKIPQTSTRYVSARSRLAWSYQDEDKAKALQIAEETLAQRPGDEDAELAVADLLRINQRYDDSIAILDRLITREGARAEWRLFYMRGAAYERADKWDLAERDLQRALSLKPDEPELLNYLGYAWVSRGEHVKEAMAMIQKAVDQEPDNGAFIDSLGWARYQLGDYKAAVANLERAAELEAGDAEVNDHLGDVYWKLGRKDEARFKWRAVLTLAPDPEIKTRVEAKLASPLGTDAVGPSRALARQ
jgi:Flp pilus assembly protein TadD